MDLRYFLVGFYSFLGEQSSVGGLVGWKSKFSSPIFLVKVLFVKVIIFNVFFQNQEGAQSEQQNLAYSQLLWVGNVGEAP